MTAPLPRYARLLIAPICAAMARWLAERTLPALEERYVDPGERWRALKANLKKYGAEGRFRYP